MTWVMGNYRKTTRDTLRAVAVGFVAVVGNVATAGGGHVIYMSPDM